MLFSEALRDKEQRRRQSVLRLGDALVSACGLKDVDPALGRLRTASEASRLEVVEQRLSVESGGPASTSVAGMSSLLGPLIRVSAISACSSWSPISPAGLVSTLGVAAEHGIAVTPDGDSRSRQL